ncbi:MAG TPA: aldehyde ferredoxin oxidoreductase C-terminal domain-containing protein, partial [Acidobacteriota bacterium]|nr:aldehyde ferredoxin oxidoreductase C-terminal domain-containing protein [Acidobacteriota bacterium]
GIYSRHKAEFIAWRMHYWNYFKESVGFCNWAYAQLFSQAHPQGHGHTPEIEPKYINAVTGKNRTFDEHLEIGRRSWNLKRAIFAIQGRHKKMENFTGYYYKPGASYSGFFNILPVFDGKAWDWQDCRELYLSREGVDTFKTHYYRVEGWNEDSGYPTRKTLEGLDLKYAADHLEKQGKLG